MPCYQPAPRSGPTPRPSLRSTEERNRLVVENLGLTFGVIRRMRLTAHPLVADLEQAGTLGLLRACELWEPSRGALSTFADHWIRRMILEELAGAGTIHVPRAPRDAPRDAHVARVRAGSLDDSLAEALNVPDAPDQAEADERAEAVRKALGTLPPRWRRVLELRMRGMIQRDVAATLGVTKQRVQTIEAKALERLAERPELRELAGR